MNEPERIEEQFTPRIETAKMMIKGYFEQHHGEVIDYVDLTNAFDLALPLIVEACGELEKEGKIAGV
jgi:hypothetical protein